MGFVDNSEMSDLIIEVKAKLPEYFAMHNMKQERNKKYKCFMNHLHKNGKDTDASLSIAMDRADGIPKFKCFGCQTGGTIFDAAEHLDGLDIKNDFLGSVRYLADKLTIEYDPEIFVRNVPSEQRIMNHITDMVKAKCDYTLLMNGTYGRDYPEARAKETAELVPVAEITAQQIESELKSKFGNDCLDNLTIAVKNGQRTSLSNLLFREGRAVSPLYNEKKQTIAFISRLNEAERLSDSSSDKYRLTGGFKKGTDLPLYFLHQSKNDIIKSGTLYIVEGMFDALAMYTAGFKNVVAMLGNVRVDLAVNAILDLGVKEVIICLDGDAAGKNIRHLLFVALAIHHIPVFYVDMQGMDPDDIVTSGKSDLFRNTEDAVLVTLRETSCFNEGAKSQERRYIECLDFVTTYCKSKAMYNKYSGIMSKEFGLPEPGVLDDLSNRLENAEKNSPTINKIKNKLKSVDNLMPDEILNILSDTAKELSTYLSKQTTNTSKHTVDIFNRFRSKDASVQTIDYKFKTGFEYLDRTIQFQSKSLAFIAAPPSNLKSTFIRALLLKMVTGNDNTLGLYVSLDDTSEKTVLNILASGVGQDRSVLEDNIRNHTLSDIITPSQETEMSIIFRNKLNVIGKEVAPSIKSIYSEVTKLRNENPDKKIICIIDAMDDLSDMRISSGNITNLTAAENILSEMSEMSVTQDILTIAIKHLKHSDHETYRPGLFSIKGTSKVEYIAKTIIIAYMDMHYHKDTQLYWTRDNENTRLPVMDLLVAKEKDTEANTRLFIHVDPSKVQIEMPNEQEAIEYADYVLNQTKSKKWGEKDIDDLM